MFFFEAVPSFIGKPCSNEKTSAKDSGQRNQCVAGGLRCLFACRLGPVQSFAARYVVSQRRIGGIATFACGLVSATAELVVFTTVREQRLLDARVYWLKGVSKE